MKILVSQFEGLLISYRGSRVVVRDLDGQDHQCKLRQAARDTVTGDRVIVEVIDGEPIVSSRIERVSEFYRTDMRGKKKMIAANLDCLVVVIASTPEPHLGLIDKYLVGAELSGIHAELLVNKSDLNTHPVIEEVCRLYPKIGYRVTEVSAKAEENLHALKEWAKGRSLAFLGQSGVGKSSLINALTGLSQADVGELSTKKTKGKHTTTASFIYEMPFGGWIMDSPGIRDFENTLWKAEELIQGFPELYELSLQCEFRNCQHRANRGCAILEAIELETIEPSRYQSYIGLVSKN